MSQVLSWGGGEPNCEINVAKPFVFPMNQLVGSPTGVCNESPLLIVLDGAVDNVVPKRAKGMCC